MPHQDHMIPPGEHDLSESIAARVSEAASEGLTLSVEGSGSKSFLGRVSNGEMLAMREHRGIIHYQPVELVLTARAGTSLADIESRLAAHGQMLAFEPPHFGFDATLGGTIACNLSGPRRPWTGAARDFVLGVRMINGRGEILHFGGEVMKNVAGYDLSRLMAGSYGTLGVLLEISLKVLPKPPVELTLVQEREPAEALHLMNVWGGRPLPLSGAAHDGANLYLRLSGTTTAVAAARKRLGGDILEEGDAWWRRLREHELGFFHHGDPLWRISLPATAPLLDLPGRWLLDWGGAQRWYSGAATPTAVRRAAARAGGHATLYRGHSETARFQPLAPPLLALHQRLKAAFDPFGVFDSTRILA